MDETTKKIGLRIRSRRQELEMTQEELAAKTGYKTKGAIAKIESGYCSMKQATLMNFARALNVTPTWLLGEEEELIKTDDGLVKIPANILQPFFNDSETGRIATKIATNRDLKLLFDTAKDATPEQLKQAHDMLLFLKNKERHSDE